MLPVNQYKQELLDAYELNSQNEIVHKKDGYRGRFKKGDKVKQFRMNKFGHLGIHIPKQKATVNVAHLVLLLNGIHLKDYEIVDHIDGNPINNDVSNLRIGTQQLNTKNRNNKVGQTGEKCITLDRTRYKVRINLNGKRIYLGMYGTLQEAIQVRDSYLQQRLNEGYTLRHLK